MNKKDLDELARRAVLILAEGVEQLTAKTTEQTEQYRQILGELYQVLGALDAGAKVLDQVSAAIHGQSLPHETLLPYAGMTDSMDELRRSVAQIMGQDQETWPSHGNAPLAIASIIALLSGSAPEGSALVPIEPTDEMLVAGQEAWAHMRDQRRAIEDCEEAAAVYKAMLQEATANGAGL